MAFLLSVRPFLISSILSLLCSSILADEGTVPSDEKVIIINEILAISDDAFPDDDGESSDWIELTNRSQEPVSLNGWHLSDDPEDLSKWTIPDVTIPGQGFLLIYASGKDRNDGTKPLHTNFKLDSDGEYLVLARPDATISHAFDPEFTSQRDGMSYGVAGDQTMRFFSTPTPGTENTSVGECFVEDTKFSVDRGFFDAPFEVSITSATPDAEILYTIDGSEPSKGNLFGGANGEVYEGPITIGKTTVLRAMATKVNWRSSNVDTQTYLFLEDVIRQSPDGAAPEGWPTGSVNGQQFDFGMDPEIVDDPEYAALVVPALKAIPSVSLVMNQSDLTDRSDGIYVNASNDGRDWERPGSVEWLVPDGGDGFQENAGIRIRGGFSRGGFNPKHSFRVFFRSEYGASRLRFPLYQEEGTDTFDKIDFRTAQNYAWSNDTFNDARKNTFLRELFARDSQRQLGQPYTRSRFFHLYLNGIYWGLYMTQERSEADYAESYFGGNADDYDVIKVEAGPYSVYATAGNIDAFNELHGLVAGDVDDALFYALQGKNSQGEDDPNLTRHVDAANLIDYMMIIFYTGSTDAPLAGSDRANNFYAVRDRVERDGWRFFAHDTEHSMIDINGNRMGPFNAGRQRQYFNPQWLHQQLMQSPAYRLMFADHVQREYFNGGVFTVSAARERWLARQAEIELAIIGESARWGDQHETRPYTHADWRKEVDWMIDTYMSRRTEIVYQQMSDVGLAGEVATPQFTPHGGVIEEPATFVLQIKAGTLFNPQPGNIYYTMDGSDPRLSDGEVSPTALMYDRDGAGVDLNDAVTVRTRLLHEGDWSPLNEAVFRLPSDGNDNWSAWKIMHGLEDENGDPDEDGLENLLEYFLARHPLEADNGAFVWLERDVEGDLVIRYLQSATAAEVSTQIESSSDMVDWTSLEDAEFLNRQASGVGQEIWNWKLPLGTGQGWRAFRIRYSLEAGM